MGKINPVELVLRTGMEGWTKDKMWKAVAMLTSHSTSVASDNARARIHFFESFRHLDQDPLQQQLVVTADDHVRYKEEAAQLADSGTIVSENT